MGKIVYGTLSTNNKVLEYVPAVIIDRNLVNVYGSTYHLVSYALCAGRKSDETEFVFEREDYSDSGAKFYYTGKWNTFEV